MCDRQAGRCHNYTTASHRHQACATPHRSVLAKGDGPGLHVEDAGDEVSLGEAAERERLLSVVVQVSAVGAVQPHV